MLGNLLLSWYREPMRRQSRAELLLPPLAPCSRLARTDLAAGERCFRFAGTETVLSLGFRLRFVLFAGDPPLREMPGLTRGQEEQDLPRAAGAGQLPYRPSAVGAAPVPALAARTGILARPACLLRSRRAAEDDVQNQGRQGNEQPRNRCLETQAAASCSARFQICTAVLRTPKISARNM